jgi:hypothetical protein
VLRQVGTHFAECSGIDGLPLLLHLLKYPGQGADILEHNAVGDQLVLFDDFALRLAIIRGDDLLASEEHPLQEVMKPFTLVVKDWANRSIIPQGCR